MCYAIVEWVCFCFVVKIDRVLFVMVSVCGYVCACVCAGKFGLNADLFVCQMRYGGGLGIYALCKYLFCLFKFWYFVLRKIDKLSGVYFVYVMSRVY